MRKSAAKSLLNDNSCQRPEELTPSVGKQFQNDSKTWQESGVRYELKPRNIEPHLFDFF